MTNKQPMTLEFDVDMSSDLPAGLIGFTDTIVVTVGSGDPGGEPGEFEKHMRSCIAEWFDGARVELAKKS